LAFARQCSCRHSLLIYRFLPSYNPHEAARTTVARAADAIAMAIDHFTV
jgi:hypothetical protein